VNFAALERSVWMDGMFWKRKFVIVAEEEGMLSSY